MGSFEGHALPGSFFIIIGLYWTVQFYRKLFKSMRKGGSPFRATVTFSCDCCCDVETADERLRLPRNQQRCRSCCVSPAAIDWEGVVKLFFSTVGFFVEVIFATVKTGRFNGFSPAQHATMFFFFGLSGLVDILVKLRSPIIPSGSEYMFGALAFIVETLLFKFHLHNRSTMNVQVHTILLYVLYATIVVVLMESKFRRVPILVFSRIFLVILQGTWFWQVGFILYRPLPGSTPWAEEDHNQLMITPLIIAWHMMVVLTVMFTIGSFVYICCYRGVGASRVEWHDVEIDEFQLLPASNSKTVPLNQYKDEDDDNNTCRP